ncbi:MAG TPA: DUF4097 family beta strand repeat-containing protein [Gaiellaceae bacterium]|nr:DUF4097 family beta strand repeat-containing protein [Gaiellaceae bacterium]
MSEQTFHTPLPLELDVNIPAGDVHVETVDGEQSTIVLDGDEKLLEHMVVEQEGNRLVVAFRGKKPFGITIAIGTFTFGSDGIRVRARVPHGAAASVTTASADLTVQGRVRTLAVKTASGDVRLRGEVEQDADVKTVSGDAHLDRVGGDVRLQTVSGDGSLGSVGGSVEAKSVSGDLRVDSVREGTASFTSVSGDVEFGIAPGSLLDVDAGSVSGDLSSEVPLGSDPAALGGEDGPTVVLRGKTVSGDVKVFRAVL